MLASCSQGRGLMWLQHSGGKDVRSLERPEHALGLGLTGQTEQGKPGNWCMTPLLPVLFLVIMVSRERYSV